ncbi:MAG: hypothetical protein QM753_02160 [Thermomicrobiales bacterium]
MNPVKLVLGFVPFLLVSVLAGRLSFAWAAGIGLVAALVLAITTAQGGVKLLPASQVAILGVLTILGVVGSAGIKDWLDDYGRSTASIALGSVVIVTAFIAPFTLQYAREAAPPAVWNTHGFLALNRQISLAWGLAVLAVGISHIAATEMDKHGDSRLLEILFSWGIPVAALIAALLYTKQVSARARHAGPGGTTA